MKSFYEISNMKKIIVCSIALLISGIGSFAQSTVIPGAERMNVYLPLLKGKAVAVFANQTSMVKHTHLVDTLLSSGINVVKIFGPEHGFRGDADAGEHVNDAKDKKTGLPVISLYGNHKKATAEDLKDVDVLIFDIQDVGVRFYTYISSLQYYLEAALENHKPLLILDRPNPNGFYVDGPVLDMKYKSFVGMQPIPIVYGMTIGEYALYLAGENLLSKEANAINAYNITTKPTADTPFHVQVIKCKNYNHNTKYVLPVMPSPNLKTMQSIYLYPSTCFFEGTVLSEGRGTEHPFEIFGHPKLPDTLTAFTPISRPGASEPKLKDQRCYGWDLSTQKQPHPSRIELKWLLRAYQLFADKDDFFIKPKKFNGGATDYYFNKLAGNGMLMQQIQQGVTEEAIRKSWQPALDSFKLVRKKYLLYTDF